MSDKEEKKGERVELFPSGAPHSWKKAVSDFFEPFEGAGELTHLQAWAAYAKDAGAGKRTVHVLYGPGRSVGEDLRRLMEEGSITLIRRGGFGSGFDLTKHGAQMDVAVKRYLTGTESLYADSVSLAQGTPPENE